MILRPATFADEKLLLYWRNDPTVLAVLPDSTPLSEERHKRWLAMVLAGHEDSLLYIAEINGVPIGQARIERAWKAISRKMDSCLIGYSIGEEYRGKGRGRWLAEILVLKAREIGYSTVACRIKRTNTLSIEVARKAGVDVIELF